MKLKDYGEQLARDPGYLAAETELRPLLDLGDDVLALRLAQNWSQADLAERVGTRQANVSRVESGLANPTVKFLQKLAEALDAELVLHLQPKQSVDRPEVQATPDGRVSGSSPETYVAAVSGGRDTGREVC
jgi:transcriptional regulator with XRE-family HTH domain